MLRKLILSLPLYNTEGWLSLARRHCWRTRLPGGWERRRALKKLSLHQRSLHNMSRIPPRRLSQRRLKSSCRLLPSQRRHQARGRGEEDPRRLPSFLPLLQPLLLLQELELPMDPLSSLLLPSRENPRWSKTPYQPLEQRRHPLQQFPAKSDVPLLARQEKEMICVRSTYNRRKLDQCQPLCSRFWGWRGLICIEIRRNIFL